MTGRDIIDVLGGKEVIPQRIEGSLDLMELAAQGVTKEALLHLVSYLNCPMSEMAQLLPVTERTIQRYRSHQHFNRVVSEHILQLAEIVAHGTEVFGDREKFLRWLRIPNVALGNRIPFELLDSRFGADMIRDELGRIEHGVFA